jgi:hypothetical protein
MNLGAISTTRRRCGPTWTALVAKDFSYATPDATDPTLFIIFQGAGQIPNNKLTINATTAHLQLTTPAGYSIVRCVLDSNTGESVCAPTSPLSFNMTWTTNGVGSIMEKLKRKEIFGPVTTKFQGEFRSATAFVNGTWGGRSSSDMSGELQDTENTTVIREITISTSP